MAMIHGFNDECPAQSPMPRHRRCADRLDADVRHSELQGAAIRMRVCNATATQGSCQLEHPNPKRDEFRTPLHTPYG